MAHLTLSTLICLIGFYSWFAPVPPGPPADHTRHTAISQSPPSATLIPSAFPSVSPTFHTDDNVSWTRRDGLQNTPDKTATIKSLYKELSPFLVRGHTPNCQIKITWMDETDNNGAILSQHLFCILDTGLIESSFAAVLRDSCGGGRPSLSSLLENFFWLQRRATDQSLPNCTWH